MYFGLLHGEILLMHTSAEYCIQPKQDVQIVLKSGSSTPFPSVTSFSTFC